MAIASGHITDIHQRTPVIIGSPTEVDLVVRLLA